jgi:two-component system NtrC family sensor kinase
MRARIGTRVILGVGLTTGLIIGGMAVLILRAQRSELVFELTRGADQLSETIKSSTHYDMMENRRENLHRQIETIGRQPGIEKVRVFSRDGRVMFSSDSSDIGLTLDKRAEACYACHAEGQPIGTPSVQSRARIFGKPGGARILGIVSPIRNEPGCASADCHAHPPEQKILGVLDVTVSMAEADSGIRRSEATLAILAALAIAASSLLLWWLNRRLVLKPVRALLAGTKRVAEGDLTARIDVTARHELGQLADAFNAMTERLFVVQRQLAQADKLASVGRLAAGVAHEINNPLTGILSYATLLQRRPGAIPEAKEDLDVIVRETIRCRDIIKNLLDFARPTPPDRHPADLDQVVRRSVAVVMNQLRIQHVDLSLDLAEDLPPGEVDSNQIQQVLVNLILNAADALEGERGSIRIATRAVAEPRPCLLISVEDSGRGIAPADLPRLFEPFFTTKGSHGTGLGLAVTWGIVEAHGGTIEVWSEESKGSRFTVRLPLAAGVPPTASLPGAATSLAGSDRGVPASPASSQILAPSPGPAAGVSAPCASSRLLDPSPGHATGASASPGPSRQSAPSPIPAADPSEPHAPLAPTLAGSVRPEEEKRS